MLVLDAIREVQIPLVAAMLLGGCVTKLARTLRTGSVDSGLGPDRPVPDELAQAGRADHVRGRGRPRARPDRHGRRRRRDAAATCVRIAAGLLFLVATSALIELRTVRPDVGCGCFGDFSTAPVSGRTIARSALLAVAHLSTIDLRSIAHRSPPAVVRAARDRGRRAAADRRAVARGRRGAHPPRLLRAMRAAGRAVVAHARRPAAQQAVAPVLEPARLRGSRRRLA